MARTKNVAEWLDASAEKFPDKIAFSDGKTSLTFAELREQARRIGSELARRGLFKQPVMIALDKESRTIATFLGAAYSGNFYVPVDIEMPPERVQKIVDKLQPSVIISSENYAEFADSAIDENLLENASQRQIDTDLLYVLFTSGSTGTPKGVAIQHVGVIDYTDKCKEIFGFDENTIFGQSHPLIFDSSILAIFQTIFNGCTDYIIPKKTLMFPAKTIDFLIKFDINAIYWVPTSYNLVANSGIFDKRVPQRVSKILFAGEQMPSITPKRWTQALPNALYANLFGPTEITDTFIYYIIDRKFSDDESIPVGKNYPNVQALILNENDELCKIGEVGELCVRGNKVSPGYYNDPERTAAVFVQNPLNKNYPEIIYRTGDLGYWNERGEIMFKGRKDFQIKHAGHRIELGEIETAASGVDDVELCACVYDDKVKQIVMFYNGTVEPDVVKEQLKTKLQPYMVPGRIEKIGEMPRTTTGKISRTELKQRL